MVIKRLTATALELPLIVADWFLCTPGFITEDHCPYILIGCKGWVGDLIDWITTYSYFWKMPDENEARKD